MQTSDFSELVDHEEAGVVVLSRGMQLVLQTCPETLAFLQDAGTTVYVLETRDAARL